MCSPCCRTEANVCMRSIEAEAESLEWAGDCVDLLKLHTSLRVVIADSTRFVFLQCMVNIHSLTVAATFGLFCIINEFIPEIRTVASLTFFSEASDIGQGQILDFFGPAWKFFLVLLNKVITFSLHMANSHTWSLENSMSAAFTPKESEEAVSYIYTYTYRCVCT